MEKSRKGRSHPSPQPPVGLGEGGTGSRRKHFIANQHNNVEDKIVNYIGNIYPSIRTHVYHAIGLFKCFHYNLVIVIIIFTLNRIHCTQKMKRPLKINYDGLIFPPLRPAIHQKLREVMGCRSGGGAAAGSSECPCRGDRRRQSSPITGWYFGWMNARRAFLWPRRFFLRVGNVDRRRSEPPTSADDGR